MGAIIKCCLGCVPPRRTPTCHVTCPDYIREKAEHEKKREAEFRRREADQGVRDMLNQGVAKQAKRRRGRK